MTFQTISLEMVRQLDQFDALSGFRSQFYIPQVNGADAIYFCGNSLGLQPVTTEAYLLRELKKWQELGVEGHMVGDEPWLGYHHLLKEPLAELVGALPDEVTAMGSLTANIHQLFASFYRPQGVEGRHKIIAEAKAFSSDQYLLESQLRMHGLDPETALIELSPRSREHTLRTEDILTAIAEAGDSLSLVFIGGLQYYTGQFFDLARITAAAHKAGAVAGFDLAHAVGNVPLQLHDWGVDFAAWCSYKYLNAGPGGVAGIYVHERHGTNADLPRQAGWWGHDEQARFEMKKGFIPMAGADGWQVSNAPILNMAALRASLELFLDAGGMPVLSQKSQKLTGLLEQLLREIKGYGEVFHILTPEVPADRGCQLSLAFPARGKTYFDHLTRHGVIADWREPDVIRIAPVPMYNTFEEVYRFAELLQEAIGQ